MRGETPEEQQQRKEYENIIRDLIARLVKYTRQSREELEDFLKWFSLGQINRFYQSLKKIVLPKKSRYFTPVVKEQPNDVSGESYGDKEPSKQPTLFKVDTMG